MDTQKRLLILDGNSLMNRAFYGIPPLTNSAGLNTNAVYGFITMLLKMKEDLKPDYIVSTFDRKAPTFRHEEYKDYKAGRKKMPPELVEQMPVIKELLKYMAIDVFEIDGFEADDLIGTLSVHAEKQGIECYIITGDKDALQLATDNVKVVITKKGMTEKEIYDRNRMIEEFGVTPSEFIDVKGLMGDTSDNIPGVPGIGEKTAYKLIIEYKSIENLLNNIENVSGKKIKENLMQYSEQAIFSKKLATIITNVPVTIDMESIRSKESYNYESVRKMFFNLGFKTLLDRLPQDEKDLAKKEMQVEYNEIKNIEEFKILEENIIKNKDNNIFVLFDILNSNVYSAATLDKLYISFMKQNYVVNLAEIISDNKEQCEATLKNLFENEEIKKVSYDVKVPYTVFNKMGIKFKAVKFDVKIAFYLIDPSKGTYSLTNVIGEMLQEEIKGEDLRIKEVSCLEDIYGNLEKQIVALGMEDLFYNVEQPLTEVLASMELLGFKVDENKLDSLGVNFKFEIEKVQKEIYALADEEFNISSPKQLGKILFEKLDLPVIKKTKTGYSTNAEVLEELCDKHPIIDKVTYYRQLSKLYSTYVEGLKNVIDVDLKIHSSFNQAVTTTGRLSSTEPNLQNIPIKYEMGREIRKVFVPSSDDCVLLSADYSQIELRVLAHIADDENMIDAFKHHSDIHTKTAAEVFKVPIDEVTSTMRSNAKAVNFGIVYGISDFSLSKDLKISKKEAKTYMEAYFDRYPGVKKYLSDIIETARENCYVTTILNRKRFIPEIKASNKMVQSFGERLAMNTPIQGSAADIIKLAMVNVYHKLEEKNLKSTLILQVHDELILNVYKDELEMVTSLVKDEMEKVMKLSVPLEVDINIGNNWYEAK